MTSINGHLSNTDTLLCPFGVRIREVRLYFDVVFVLLLLCFPFFPIALWQQLQGCFPYVRSLNEVK